MSIWISLSFFFSNLINKKFQYLIQHAVIYHYIMCMFHIFKIYNIGIHFVSKMCIFMLVYRFNFTIILDILNFTIMYAMNKDKSVLFKTQFDSISRLTTKLLLYVGSRRYLPTNGTNQR